MKGLLRLGTQDGSFQVGPELGTEVAREIEPESKGALQHAEAYGIQAVRIPLI